MKNRPYNNGDGVVANEGLNMTARRYKALLWDWDGNIAKTLNIWLEAYQGVLGTHGYAVSDEEVCANFTRFRSFIGELGFHDPAGAMAEADRKASQLLPDIELYPGVSEVIGALYERGKDMALITSSGRSHVVTPLERYGLERYFKVIVTGDDVQERKPHPEPILKALGVLGTTKEVSLIIGDSASDIVAANNIGLDSVLFYPPEHQRFYSLDTLRSLKPTYIVEDSKEILDIVTP